MEYILLGVAVGTLAGLMPGIGIFASLLICYPWMLQLSVAEAFSFYLALATTTQYIGSVSATIFGVPGEASSLPAVTEGNTLYNKGLGGDAISGAALGSLLAGSLTSTGGAMQLTAGMGGFGLALAFSETVNQVQSEGLDLNGTQGNNIFSDINSSRICSTNYS